MTIEWSDPPRATRRGKWGKVLKELQAAPSMWAKLYEGQSRNAYSLAGRLRKQAGPEFEFTSRSLGDGQAGVWGQYIGPQEPQIAEVAIEGDHASMQPEELPDPI